MGTGTDFKRKELEQLAAVRLARGSREVKAVLDWLHTLELQAVEALVDCRQEDHADRAARVQILRLLQAKIVTPTLAESQANYTVTTDA